MKKIPVVTYAQYIILETISDDPTIHISQDNKKTALRLVAKRYLSQTGEYSFRITKTGYSAFSNPNIKIIR